MIFIRVPIGRLFSALSLCMRLLLHRFCFCTFASCIVMSCCQYLYHCHYPLPQGLPLALSSNSSSKTRARSSNRLTKRHNHGTTEPRNHGTMERSPAVTAAAEAVAVAAAAAGSVQEGARGFASCIVMSCCQYFYQCHYPLPQALLLALSSNSSSKSRARSTKVRIGSSNSHGKEEHQSQPGKTYRIKSPADTYGGKAVAMHTLHTPSYNEQLVHTHTWIHTCVPPAGC